MKRLVLAGKHVSHTAAADPRSESISAGQQDARSRQIDQRGITLAHLLSVPSCTSNALTPVESQLAGEPSGPLSPLPSGWEERSVQRGLAPTTIGPIRAQFTKALVPPIKSLMKPLLRAGQPIGVAHWLTTLHWAVFRLYPNPDRCPVTNPRPGPSRSRKLRAQPMCGWTYCAPRPRQSVVEMQVLRLPASGLFATMLGSADCRGGPGGLFGLSLPPE